MRGSHGAGRAAWLAAAALLLAALGNRLYVSIQPQEPRRCGSPGGAPVTAPRVRARDGRFLAYAETGVPRADARYKIVMAHGFTGSRHDILRLRTSEELIKELAVYVVGYDRAGYGESDPNPGRSPKTEAHDIEDLADALELGRRFYVVGFSLGGHAVWGSLKYIPGRLAGAALIAPVVNYRWPGFPRNLSAEVFYQQDVGDQWSIRVAYYAPWLLNWWMKQTWLPSSTVAKGTVSLPNRLDAQLREQAISTGAFLERIKVATQQGVHESLNRDMLVMFGKWEFDPMDLQPAPFPVHLWQGDEDGLVPVALQRHICCRLSWIEYHELKETGHYLTAVPGFGDLLLKTLLL